MIKIDFKNKNNVYPGMYAKVKIKY